MNEVRLNRNNGRAWFSNDRIWAKGFLFDEADLWSDENLLAYFDEIDDEAALIEKLKRANGLFAVVLKMKDEWFAATDIIRSFPLFYKNEENFVISDNVEALLDNKDSFLLDEESVDVFRATGYVTGSSTLLKGVAQIEAGQYICVKNGEMQKHFYHSFAEESDSGDFEKAKQELKNILQRVGARLVKTLGNHPVALPLSGGLDSRLIAWMLKKNNYNQVLCFTYGNSLQNPELERAKKVAEHFGFEWCFIDYSGYLNRQYADTKDFMDYCDYASNYSSKFFFSEYFAMDFLKNVKHISLDTVFLPGHSGDTISGSHLRPYMRNYSSVKNIAKDLAYKQFELIQTTLRQQRHFARKIQTTLAEERFADYRAYENWIVKERQAKYIVNSCKLWEYNQLGYLLPLWDKELVDFLARQSFDFRLYQKLYRQTLCELFSEENLWFGEDEKKFETSFKQNCKVIIKRLLPFLRKKNDPFVGDHYHFREITKPLLAKVKHPENIRSFNGIFTEWYIEQLRSKLESKH
ncbi:MAG: asparagine synthase-related protein [Bacteroidales bacterium]|nr:asparagine synthase-related protein [Bacteroidales bacterium]